MKPLSDYRESTKAYYDENAAAFCADTVALDMSALYEPFLRAIPAGGRILDAGCGSGRDSAAFLRLGYSVVSVDTSVEMLKATAALTGQMAIQLPFEEIDFNAEFDGIWSCASLLHVPRFALGDVLDRLTRALKPDGVLYMSFKGGQGERTKGGRLFNDMDESSLSDVLANHPLLEILQCWQTDDVRNDPPARRQWLNTLVKRVAPPAVPTHCDQLLWPTRLWTRTQVLSPASPIPRAAGVYAWYFRNLPTIVPTATCLALGVFRLLYVGISPSAPPKNGKAPSRQSIWSRVRYHMRGNAEGSTLRLSLGCLLADELGIELRRVGSGTRFTFSAGEARLSEWMSQNARVVWHPCDEPWKLEEKLISTIPLPLNLDQNRSGEFHAVLSALRRAARIRAKALPSI